MHPVHGEPPSRLPCSPEPHIITSTADDGAAHGGVLSSPLAAGLTGSPSWRTGPRAPGVTLSLAGGSPIGTPHPCLIAAGGEPNPFRGVEPTSPARVAISAAQPPNSYPSILDVAERSRPTSAVSCDRPRRHPIA